MWDLVLGFQITVAFLITHMWEKNLLALRLPYPPNARVVSKSRTFLSVDRRLCFIAVNPALWVPSSSLMVCHVALSSLSYWFAWGWFTLFLSSRVSCNCFPLLALLSWFASGKCSSQGFRKGRARSNCQARVSSVLSYLRSALSLFRRKVAEVATGGSDSLLHERLLLEEFFTTGGDAVHAPCPRLASFFFCDIVRYYQRAFHSIQGFLAVASVGLGFFLLCFKKPMVWSTSSVSAASVSCVSKFRVCECCFYELHLWVSLCELHLWV
jgi:hypothetical protein